MTDTFFTSTVTTTIKEPIQPQPEFRGWPKISRLFRSVIVTEKIDGSNAAVIIDREYVPTNAVAGDIVNGGIIVELFPEDFSPTFVWVGAQSRKQLITPENDNYRFAAWVREHAWQLTALLGEGRHFGEWWGSGINRGYGLEKREKRLSLFNVKRFEGVDYNPTAKEIGVDTIPVIDRYEVFDTNLILLSLAKLKKHGSYAAPGYHNPEGIVTFHEASQSLFKTLIENDDTPKGNNGSNA